VRANVRVEGVDEARRAFRRLPKEAKKSLRDRTRDLSEALASSARRAGMASDAQSAAVAGLVKARRGETPFIAGGGTTRVTSTSTPAYKIIFGAEFGSNRLKQFRPHRGKLGYWLFPTVEREKTKITKAWLDVADDVIKDFTKGGA